VSSTYSFEYCEQFVSQGANRGCVVYDTTTVQVAPLVPSFSYKYEVTTNLHLSLIV
jgi:hypothetical protein